MLVEVINTCCHNSHLGHRSRLIWWFPPSGTGSKQLPRDSVDGNVIFLQLCHINYVAPKIAMERKKRMENTFQLPLSKRDTNHFYSQSIDIFYLKLEGDGERKQMSELYGRHLYVYYNREVQDPAKQFKPTSEQNNFLSCKMRENRMHLKQKHIIWCSGNVRKLSCHCVYNICKTVATRSIILTGKENKKVN